MWSVQLCLIGFLLPAFVLSGPYPNFRSEVEIRLLEDEPKDWWETSSLYQIYPRSFKDTNGDGIGDIKGITEMLPYLKTIGVTGTWLSPIFKSPMADFGYDIADYRAIQEEYGTIDDFKEMVAKAKELGIKIILDFVPNHSSDECEWFQKSIDKIEPYTDYYIWHDGFKDPKDPNKKIPPNNWVSVFRGHAWTWNEKRQQFYFHQFASKQPDLNYRNPLVVEEMKKVLVYWLDYGIDGFRIDAIPHLFEIAPDAQGNYENEPLTGNTDDDEDYGYTDHIYTKDLPETIDMVYQWRKVVDDYKAEHLTETKILLTEAYSSLETLMKYYGNGTVEGSHIPFNFELISNLGTWSNANDYVRFINGWMDNMPKGRTANWVLGNHDKNRIGSRFGTEKMDLLNMLLLILPGVSITYQGEEIGMTDVWISWKDTVDPQACNTNENVYESYSRDPARTPFQWDDTTSAGFSTSTKTWLPVSENYKTINVKKELTIPRSHLNTYIRTKELRAEKTLQNGDYKGAAFNDNAFGIMRSLVGGNTYIYAANIGSKMERVDLTKLGKLPEIMEFAVVSQRSSYKIGEKTKVNSLMLLPDEAVILRSTTTLHSLLGYEYYVH